MTNETMETLGQAIAGALPDAVAGYVTTHGELTLTVNAADIVRVATFLRDDPRCAFSCFIDVTAVDWPQRERRFDVVYHLLSIPNQCVLRLKVRVGQRSEEHPSLPTVVGVWPGANWYEREVYDLFGLTFTGHPDMRRILMPMDWTTHPLRKDYPLTGFDLPEPHWGGQVPYDTNPGVGSQTLRTPEGRELNENRSHISQNQEPGTKKK